MRFTDLQFFFQFNAKKHLRFINCGSEQLFSSTTPQRKISHATLTQTQLGHTNLLTHTHTRNLPTHTCLRNFLPGRCLAYGTGLARVTKAISAQTWQTIFFPTRHERKTAPYWPFHTRFSTDALQDRLFLSKQGCFLHSATLHTKTHGVTHTQSQHTNTFSRKHFVTKTLFTDKRFLCKKISRRLSQTDAFYLLPRLFYTQRFGHTHFCCAHRQF